MTYDQLNHWYGWNGGECPVHPRTVVDVALLDGEPFFDVLAGDFAWSADPIIGFRIVKEHKEPREWWLVRYSPIWYKSRREAAEQCGPSGEIIHVREVTD